MTIDTDEWPDAEIQLNITTNINNNNNATNNNNKKSYNTVSIDSGDDENEDIKPIKTNTITGKRRNTIDIGKLSKTTQQHIQNNNNNTSYASNKKLKPNQRLSNYNKNIDNRNIGDNNNNNKNNNTVQLQQNISNRISTTTTSVLQQWYQHTSRNYTISIALPGSIINNCQTSELKTYVAGQIARSCAIFNINEIIVYNESPSNNMINIDNTLDGEFYGSRAKHSDANLFLARILQYLDTPQYLRKYLYPVHPDLKYAGLLNPIDSPHHIRSNEDVLYRQGVTVEYNHKKQHAPHGCSYVNIGLKYVCLVNISLKYNIRVTVKLDEPIQGSTQRMNLTGTIVSPNEPYNKYGLYYGYNVRLCMNGLNDIFQYCPYNDTNNKYDLCIGTSENGTYIHDKLINNKINKLNTYKHILIVFGGLTGLEDVVKHDETITTNNASNLFDIYINVCKYQGSRTIRTEEAIPITMSTLQYYLHT